MNTSGKLLKLVRNGNVFYYSGTKETCTPFFIETEHVGMIRSDVVQHLKEFPHIFLFLNKNEAHNCRIQLNPTLKSFDERSSQIAVVLNELRQRKLFSSLEGWRNEEFDVWYKFSAPPLMKMERTGTCLFGVKQCGVHINGYVHNDDGISMWLGRRAKTKPTWPGKLDQMAAGGLSSGETIMECARKESQEEASVPENLLSNLKYTGCISYMYEDERGVFPECQYIMDLELPPEFTPVNADGEVESFRLVPIAEVKELIVKEEFKLNCALVILDFLIRHSFITPDNEPNYFELLRGIHDPLF